jgi:hypothetical protein
MMRGRQKRLHEMENRDAFSDQHCPYASLAQKCDVVNQMIQRYCSSEISSSAASPIGFVAVEA